MRHRLEILIGDRWQRIGAPHGEIACFSLHGRKPVTTGEGGMLTTADARLAQALRLLRNHGMSIPAHVRHATSQVEFEQYDVHGYNMRLSDIAAAIGREQLKRLPAIVEARRALARRYDTALHESDFATPLTEPAWARSNWQSYPIRLRDGLNQRAVMQFMLDQGIATRRGIMCAHLEPSWPAGSWICAAHRNNCPGPQCQALAESEKGRDRHIFLPLHPGLSAADQDRVIGCLARACQ